MAPSTRSEEITASKAAQLYKQTPLEAAREYTLAQPSVAATLVCAAGLLVEWLWLRSVMDSYYDWKEHQASILNNNNNNGSSSHTVAPTKLPVDTSIVGAGIPIFLAAIAIEFLASLALKPDLFRLPELIADMSTGLMQQLLEMLVNVSANLLGLSLIAMIPYSFIYDNFRVLDIDGPMGWLGALLGRDLCYYVFHYASHRVAFLWAIHGVHHQPNEFNYGVNLSQGALQTIASAPFYAPLALFFNPAIFAVVYPLSKIYGFFTHTRLVGKTYFLELLFVLPSAHRVHHAGAPSAYIDKNYGEVFTLWDRLFGTWQEETAPPVFGHVQPMATWDPLEAQFVVWRKLAEKASHCKTVSQKIWCFLGPPGWNPDTDGEYPLPDTTPYNAVKYDSSVPTLLTVYTGVHFLLALALGVALLVAHKTLFPSYASVAVLAFAAVFSVTVCGKIFDRQPSAPLWEMARLGVVLPLAGAFLLYDSGLLSSLAGAPLTLDRLELVLQLAAEKARLPASVSPVIAFVVAPSLAVLSSLAVLLANRSVFRREAPAVWAKRVWIPEAGRAFGKALSAAGVEYWKSGPVPDALLDGPAKASSSRDGSSVVTRSAAARKAKVH